MADWFMDETGAMVPSQDIIAQETAKIRKKWSERETKRREAVKTPELSLHRFNPPGYRRIEHLRDPDTGA